jgi:hypothetical protein
VANFTFLAWEPYPFDIAPKPKMQTLLTKYPNLQGEKPKTQVLKQKSYSQLLPADYKILRFLSNN